MHDRGRSPLRFLAPLALIAAALVFVVVIAGGLAGDDQEPAGTKAAGEGKNGQGSGRRGGGSSAPETYEVQEGDTLDAIAGDTGVSAEEIQALNPDLDPQSLIAGQELQLSE